MLWTNSPFKGLLEQYHQDYHNIHWKQKWSYMHISSWTRLQTFQEGLIMDPNHLPMNVKSRVLSHMGSSGVLLSMAKRDSSQLPLFDP